jgi:hypothetical protein
LKGKLENISERNHSQTIIHHPNYINDNRFSFTDNPIEFLENLNNAYKMQNPCVRNIWDFIIGHLKGEAKYWFQLEKGEISNIKDFSIYFKEQFHGTKYDNLISRELGTNNYQNFGHISPFEYFVNTVSRAKDSTINYSERYIWEAMSRQFGDSVEYACKIQNVVRTRDFMNLLERIGEHAIRRELRITKERRNISWERNQRENQGSGGHKVKNYGKTNYRTDY